MGGWGGAGKYKILFSEEQPPNFFPHINTLTIT